MNGTEFGNRLSKIVLNTDKINATGDIVKEHIECAHFLLEQAKDPNINTDTFIELMTKALTFLKEAERLNKLNERRLRRDGVKVRILQTIAYPLIGPRPKITT